MTTLNKPLCATNYGNTGFGDCFLEPGKIKGSFQVPSSLLITLDDLPDLQALLTEKVSAPIGQRIFPYHGFISNTDNTEDPTINTTDYGDKMFIRDGFYDFTFRYTNGGVMAHQEFQKNEGTNKYFLFYDDNGNIFGYKKSGGLAGIKNTLFKVNPWRFASGSDTAQYTMRHIIDPIYMNKGNLGFIHTDSFNFFDILGIEELAIQFISLAGSAAKVKLVTKISGVDMYEAYSTEFASPTAWEAVDEQGNTINISNVTLDSTNQAWNVFMTTGFASADKVFLRTADADVLDGLGITGFEGHEPVQIEGPAS